MLFIKYIFNKNIPKVTKKLQNNVINISQILPNINNNLQKIKKEYYATCSLIESIKHRLFYNCCCV